MIIILFLTNVLAFPDISDSRIEHKECYGKDISVAHMAFGLSFEECLTECQHRNVCVGIRYHPPSKHCSVLDGLALDALENLNNKCLFVNISVWDASPVTACEDHSCSSNEKCKPSDEDPNTPVCEPSECPSAPSVDYAHPLSNTRKMGTTNRYACNGGYSLVGNPEIKCQDNAQWSTPSFMCERQCRRPRDFYNSAELVAVSSVNNFGPGTQLYFKCKAGYNKHQMTTSIVCPTSWWRIHCCPDDYFYNADVQWCLLPPFARGEVTTYDGILGIFITSLYSLLIP